MIAAEASVKLNLDKEEAVAETQEKVVAEQPKSTPVTTTPTADVSQGGDMSDEQLLAELDNL